MAIYMEEAIEFIAGVSGLELRQSIHSQLHSTICSPDETN